MASLGVLTRDGMVHLHVVEFDFGVSDLEKAKSHAYKVVLNSNDFGPVSGDRNPQFCRDACLFR